MGASTILLGQYASFELMKFRRSDAPKHLTAPTHSKAGAASQRTSQSRLLMIAGLEAPATSQRHVRTGGVNARVCAALAPLFWP